MRARTVRIAPVIAATSIALCGSAPARAQPSPSPGVYPAQGWYPPQGAYPPPSAHPPPGPYPAQSGYPGTYPIGVYPCMIAPREIEWDPRDPVPPGYVLKSKPRLEFVVAGAATLGATWMASLTAALIVPNEGGVGPLFVPVVGPFITIGTARASGVAAFLLVFDGLIQSAGAGMLIAGLAAQQPIIVRVRNISVRPTPMSFGRDAHGFGLMGTF